MLTYKSKIYLKKKNFLLFVLLKYLNILRINLLFITKETLSKIFKILFIDVNFNIYPLVNPKKISLNFNGFNNKFLIIFLNKLIYINKTYNLRKLDKKFKNFYNFSDKGYVPLSIIEFFFKKENNINLIETKQKIELDQNYKIIDNKKTKTILINKEYGFFHYYIQIIPFLFKKLSKKNYNFISISSNKKFINNLNNIFLDKFKKIKKRNYKFFLINQDNFYPYSRNIFFLRFYFKKKLNLNYSNYVSKRYYIPRLNMHSKGRMIFEENKIIKDLKRNNFKILYPDKLTLVQQIKKFNEASIIIAPHGAALSNIIFINKNCKIIELNGNKDVRWHYAKIMKDLKFWKNYYLLIGTQKGDKYIEFDNKILLNKILEIIKN